MLNAESEGYVDLKESTARQTMTYSATMAKLCREEAPKKAKAKLTSEQVADDTDAFLARGGKVTVIANEHPDGVPLPRRRSSPFPEMKVIFGKNKKGRGGPRQHVHQPTDEQA